MSANPSDLDLWSTLAERVRTSEIRVPPYPAVAASLQRLGDKGATLPAVAAIVQTDPVLAALVLRRASSAALGGGGRPSTLEAAIWRLGFDELFRVVIANGLGATAHAGGPLAPLRRDQWRRSILAATLASELASRRGVPSDAAYLAGLLHDFGAIVAVACLEAMDPAHLPTWPAPTWARLIDDLHLEIGMIVAKRWVLPEAIAEVIARHHLPHESARIHRPLVQLVAMVDEVIAILDRAGAQGIAALAEVPGLDHDERLRVRALMPKVAAQMALYEAPARPERVERVAPGPDALGDGWPVDLRVQVRGAMHRLCSLAPSALAFESSTAFAAAWLVEAVIETPTERIAVLANVLSCESRPGGRFVVSVQPFGMDDEARLAWARLVASTRPAQP